MVFISRNEATDTELAKTDATLGNVFALSVLLKMPVMFWKSLFSDGAS